MKKTLIMLALLGFCAAASAQPGPGRFQVQQNEVTSPDGRLSVNVILGRGGAPAYTVSYDSNVILENSPLGLVTTGGDLTRGLEFVSAETESVSKNYTQAKIKKSQISYNANRLTFVVKDSKGQELSIIFEVSNNDIAFRYKIGQYRNRYSTVILKEATGFDFPLGTTTFLSAQADPMTGFAQTKPSYEEGYGYDDPMDKKSTYGNGYTFPCLFHIGDNWALISETGVTGKYVGSHLSEEKAGGLYTIDFPDEREISGWASSSVAMALPGYTPYRTITVGDNLAPIVETTIPYDVVEPLYQPSQDYVYGKSTWSWIMWGDGATVYDDQVKYIDLAAAMGYKYCLVDALWDTQIGRDRIEELSKYAQSKGVSLFLWYNSNGAWNDAPQGPRGCMSTSIERAAEMKWLKKIGVKGLKIDFFGSDKQPMMQTYEDILSDANEYGLMIIFHGCTLPRGWERMYPNFVGAEAVLASENLMFSQDFNDIEAVNASTHPFMRNTVAAMEYGGSPLNKHWNRDNKRGNTRRTTDAFELATAVLFQNPIQNFAIAPNNLEDAPAEELDYMRAVPTEWDDIRYIDGYPGQFAIVARRSGDKWYIAGVNGQKTPLKYALDLKAFGLSFDKKGTASADFTLWTDNAARETVKTESPKAKNGIINLEVQPDGGFVVIL